VSRLSHDRRIQLLAILAALPGILVALILLWTGAFAPKVQWTLAVMILGVYWACIYALRERVVSPLQTISNLLAALREDDFSIRARSAGPEDPLGQVAIEVNALSQTLRDQRLGAVEATHLLHRVMASLEVAVFTFDGEQHLRLVNRAGERLMAQPAERLLGRSAKQIGLADCLEGEPNRTLERTFPGAVGRWGVRRSSFREGGLPHHLLVLTDLSRALREEERQAWQRLIRVLGHELNNSLTPIKSMAGTLENLLVREPVPADWREDMRRGLAVIGGRSEALSRFMEAYSRLARLPQPRRLPIRVGDWLRRVVRLETRLEVGLGAGAELTLQADPDQLDQLLINLVRNAVDAALETGGGVRAGWSKSGGQLEVWVEDDGPGLGDTANLFVPFFTTKPGGSGIGLVLSRQIAEAHGGSLVLENRSERSGCRARLLLPL
jgi:nitrogen fixation/metabolism regulation signal transduction histidine kinase